VSQSKDELVRFLSETDEADLAVAWRKAGGRAPYCYAIGWSGMSESQVREFAFQLLGIVGWESAGPADAEILEAADRLIGNMGEGGSHITTTRSVLAMAAERARERQR
jgi:hypothetical protein